MNCKLTDYCINSQKKILIIKKNFGIYIYIEF